MERPNDQFAYVGGRIAKTTKKHALSNPKRYGKAQRSENDKLTKNLGTQKNVPKLFENFGTRGIVIICKNVPNALRSIRFNLKNTGG